jgi:hypothetical protein
MDAWLPFLAGAAATFTFVVTVFLPTMRSELIPLVSPSSAVKVESSLITDMYNVYWLQNKMRRERVAVNELPLSLKVTNLGQSPLVVDEILVRFTDVSTRVAMGSTQQILREWVVKENYTGAAEADYNIFVATLPQSAGGSVSLFAGAIADPSSGHTAGLSKYKHLYYRIPPNDTDIIGLEVRGGPPEHIQRNYELQFQLNCTSRGNQFAYIYKVPFNLALIKDSETLALAKAAEHHASPF